MTMRVRRRPIKLINEKMTDDQRLHAVMQSIIIIKTNARLLKLIEEHHKYILYIQ